MKKVKTYLDPLAPGVEFCVRDQWVSDAAYGEVVRKMIIPCTDAIFYKANDKAIYLGRRSALPMEGIWCFGGRMFFNDRTPEESVSRCIEIETGLRIAPNRFVFVRTNLYSWVKVAQGDFPGKNLGITYGCEVTEAEIEQMAHGLSAREYDRDFGIQRFDNVRLIDEGVHPAMVDIYNDLFPK